MFVFMQDLLIKIKGNNIGDICSAKKRVADINSTWISKSRLCFVDEMHFLYFYIYNVHGDMYVSKT